MSNVQTELSVTEESLMKEMSLDSFNTSAATSILPLKDPRRYENSSTNVCNTIVPELISQLEPPTNPPASSCPQPPVPAKWLDAAFVQGALRTKHPDVEVETLHLEPAVAAGENYVSIVFRANVETNQGPFALIIKCLPTAEFRTKFVTENELTVREMRFYELTYPLLKSYARENSPALMTATCYYTVHEDNKDAVVLQDLKPFGYKTSDRKTGLDYNHCTLALKELAKLHAFSIAMKLRNPQEFEREICKKYPENVYCIRNTEMFDVFISKSLRILSDDILKHYPLRFHALGNIMRDMSTVAFSMLTRLLTIPQDIEEQSKTILVLTHGDFWSNNILFKYDTDENKNPVSCCLIDYQISRCSSPVLDLLYFFYTSTVQATRRQHLDFLLQIYLDTVYSSLVEMGIPRPIPTSAFFSNVDEMKEGMKSMFLFGFISACTIMPIVVAEKEDAPDMDSMTEETLKNDDSTFMKLYTGAAFRCRFQEVLEDFDDEGFFIQFKEDLAKLKEIGAIAEL